MTTRSPDRPLPRHPGHPSARPGQGGAHPGQGGGIRDGGHPGAGALAPLRKPDWIRAKAPVGPAVARVKRLLRDQGLATVCEEAQCPNLGECFTHGTATFMILGDLCTRRCPFCDVAHGRPEAPDPAEPRQLADAVAALEPALCGHYLGGPRRPARWRGRALRRLPAGGAGQVPGHAPGGPGAGLPRARGHCAGGLQRHGGPGRLQPQPGDGPPPLPPGPPRGRLSGVPGPAACLQGPAPR